MPIDLSYGADVEDLVTKTSRFIKEYVLPIEERFGGDIEAAGGDEIRREMNAKAKAEGIFAPHAPVEFGGLGLDMSDRAPVFEAAGYSTFGPVALHIGRPTRATCTCSPTSRARNSATPTSHPCCR